MEGEEGRREEKRKGNGGERREERKRSRRGEESGKGALETGVSPHESVLYSVIKTPGTP